MFPATMVRSAASHEETLRVPQREDPLQLVELADVFGERRMREMAESVMVRMEERMLRAPGESARAQEI